MPESDFNSLKELLEVTPEGNRTCGIDRFNNNFLYCSCLKESYDDFPDLHITLGGAMPDNPEDGQLGSGGEMRTYTIPSRSYIDHKNLKCYFKI